MTQTDSWFGAQSLIYSPLVTTADDWHAHLRQADDNPQCALRALWTVQNWIAALARATPEQMPLVVEEYARFVADVQQSNRPPEETRHVQL